MKGIWDWWQRRGVMMFTLFCGALILYYVILYAVEAVR